MTDLVVDSVFRWVHILAAITALGGSFFLRLALLPAAREALSDEDHGRLQEVLLRRWKRIVHTAIALLLLSGLYNVYRAMAKHGDQPLYHVLLTVKLLAALGVFFLAIVLTSRSRGFEKFRRQRIRWTSVLCLLGVVVVLVSGVLKNLPPTSNETASKAAVDHVIRNDGG